MLSGNWLARLFGTFFKHASTFEKVLGDGHWHLLAESPIHPNRGDQGFVPRSERISASGRAWCVQVGLNCSRIQSPPVHAGGFSFNAQVQGGRASVF
jgi:hypothetical protein